MASDWAAPLFFSGELTVFVVVPMGADAMAFVPLAAVLELAIGVALFLDPVGDAPDLLL